MHTAALILLVLAVGRGGGMRTSGGDGTPSRWMANGVERAVNTTSAQLSKVMRFNGSVTSLDWTQVTPGGDGQEGDTFTVSLLVAGVPVCSLEVACDAPRGDYSKECPSAPFAAGDDVDVRVTATSCLAPATGFPAIDGTAR
jgi:hypothetical protein